MIDFKAMRQNMIANQILPNKVVTPRLIQALYKVRREHFVPSFFKNRAYSECDIEIAPGRYMLLPMVLSRLIEAAEIKPRDHVLIIGAGTGYGAALVSFLCETVIAIEQDADVCEQAQKNLATEGFSNITLHHLLVPSHTDVGMTAGWPDNAPYDVILIEGGGVAELSLALLPQLNSTNGRLVYMHAQKQGQPAQAMRITRQHDHFKSEPLFEAHAPRLAIVSSAPGYCMDA
jgi:protein-L-isoaspartate(D-aspartate) O-methyltransferase